MIIILPYLLRHWLRLQVNKCVRASVPIPEREVYTNPQQPQYSAGPRIVLVRLVAAGLQESAAVDSVAAGGFAFAPHAAAEVAAAADAELVHALVLVLVLSVM